MVDKSVRHSMTSLYKTVYFKIFLVKISECDEYFCPPSVVIVVVQFVSFFSPNALFIEVRV